MMLTKNVMMFISLLFFVNNVYCWKYSLKDANTAQILNLVKGNLKKDNPIIVEAGAFNGDDTKKMSLMWPASLIYSFEPVPEIYNLLCENTKNFKNVKCFQMALFEKNGIAKFYNSVSDFAPNKSFASGSLLAPKEHLKSVSWVKFDKTFEVPTITLDSWALENKIDHIDFIWFDMQGVELNVIKSSPKIISTVKAIYTEVEFVEFYKGQYLYKDVKDYLQKLGFEIIAADFTDDEIETKHLEEGNVLFIR